MAQEVKVLKLSPKQERVVEYMRQNGGISPKEAEDVLADHRLAVTISGLRAKGYPIKTLRIDVKNKFGEDTWYGKYVFGND